MLQTVIDTQIYCGEGLLLVDVPSWIVIRNTSDDIAETTFYEAQNEQFSLDKEVLLTADRA